MVWRDPPHGRAAARTGIGPKLAAQQRSITTPDNNHCTRTAADHTKTQNTHPQYQRHSFETAKTHRICCPPRDSDSHITSDHGCKVATADHDLAGNHQPAVDHHAADNTSIEHHDGAVAEHAAVSGLHTTGR